MVFSLSELFDIVVMTAAVGFIFADIFGRYSHKKDYEPLVRYKHGFDWDSFKFAIYVTAPAIIFHEFGHKFVGMAFGLVTEFNAAYSWLALGIALKLFGAPFIFFVPAYVSIYGSATPLEYAVTAFAGPLINLLIWMGALVAVKKKLVKKQYHPALILTGKINMFLFIFNMLPIPGFDGSKVFAGLIAAAVG